MSAYTRRLPRALVLGLSLGLVTGAPAAAERGDVELTPMVGYYTAQANSIDEVIPGVGSVTARRADTVAGGLRLTAWVRPSLALEISGLYSSGTLDGQAFGVEGEMGETSFFGAGRLVLSPASQSARVLFSAGLVLAVQDYEFVEGSSFMAGVVGVGLKLPMGEAVSLRLDVDDYIYNTWWEVGDQRTTSLTQHDVVSTVGISFSLGQ
jgi:hypothetical protein